MYFLPFMIGAIMLASACSAPKGGIVILENPNNTGFTMDFKEWSSQNKCELPLSEGDVLQIEVLCEDGEIALTISGQNGSEPYTGNSLKSGMFTVTVPETDKYEMRIAGKGATGRVEVKKAEGAAAVGQE